MTRMGKATEKGLEEVSKAVLAPSFHHEGVESKKVFDVSVYCSSHEAVSVAYFMLHQVSVTHVIIYLASAMLQVR